MCRVTNIISMYGDSNFLSNNEVKLVQLLARCSPVCVGQLHVLPACHWDPPSSLSLRGQVVKSGLIEARKAQSSGS